MLNEAFTNLFTDVKRVLNRFCFFFFSISNKTRQLTTVDSQNSRWCVHNRHFVHENGVTKIGHRHCRHWAHYHIFFPIEYSNLIAASVPIMLCVVYALVSLGLVRFTIKILCIKMQSIDVITDYILLLLLLLFICLVWNANEKVVIT